MNENLLALLDRADPAAGFSGGLLIGLAAALMLLGAGRIAGVAGWTARAVGLADDGPPRVAAWAFLVGLPAGATLIAWIGGMARPLSLPGWPWLVVAGLLVGFGTRLGSGCTSGHGVCGLSRLSPRSIVATLSFMAAGVATVAVLRRAGMLP